MIIILLIFAVIVAALSGFARWLGASRWIAVLIPLFPVGIWALAGLNADKLAGVLLCVPLLLATGLISGITVFAVKPRRRRRTFR
jgi:hypothetical protein